MQLDVRGPGDCAARPGIRRAQAGAKTASALLDALWHGPTAIAFLDADLRFVEVNDAFARIVGLVPEALAGRFPRDFLDTDEPLAFAIEDRLRAVVSSGEPARDLTASSRGLDGAPRWWRASLYPVTAAEGEARRVCVVVDETTSVHDRERALERARTAAERNARRLASLQDAIASLSAALEPGEIGRAVIERMRAFAEADAISILLLEAEELVPLSSAGLRRPGPWAGSVVPTSARVPSADALRAGCGVWLESSDEIAARYPHLLEASRAEGWNAGAALPLRARGRAIGTISLSFRAAREFDLEERAFLLSVAEHCALALDRARLLEHERRARAEAERDRSVLDGVFGNAPVGLALLDRELRFLRVNPVVAAMDGAPVDAHPGRSPHELLPSLPRGEVEPMLRRVLETGEPRVDVPVEVPFAGGGVRRFLVSSYRVQTGGGPIGVGAIVRDVTAEHEAEEFQRSVLGVVGHDLRTPLTTITNATYLLEHHGALDGAQARLLRRIAAAGERIRQVIAILLDYAHASAGGGVPVRTRACDLGAICREVADEAEGAHPGRSVRCRGEGDPSGDWDPDRLRQALANLVSNAVEHGAPDAPVDVRWRGDAERVELEVTNAGAAISPDLLPRIFDAFRRGRGDRASGLGLGLFIAHAIAVAHGGGIDVRSGERETAFTLRLPRRRPECS